MSRRTYDPDKHCGGKARHGGPCTNWLGQGTDHVGIGKCASHGGKTPTHRAAAQEQQARDLAQTLGVAIEHDPKDGILSAIYWSFGHIHYFRAQVQRLSPDMLVWGTTGRRFGHGPEGPIDVTEESAAASAWYRLYCEERDRHAKLCVEAVKIGLDERRVKLAEQQAGILVESLGWLMAEARLRLDLSEAGQSALSDLVREMLGRMDAAETVSVRR